MSDLLFLRDLLVRNGLAPRSARWNVQHGGRTNRVWQVVFEQEALICKQFLPDEGNPLFPNMAKAEHDALIALSGHKIAPEPLAYLMTPRGQVVVYRHLHGQPWKENTAQVSRLLARLHSGPRHSGLRCLNSGSAALSKQIKGILAVCKSSEWVPELPDPGVQPCAQPTLIHTDVVASNIIVTKNGPYLIDWQCPALGDPCEDLASFLSPAMHHLYGAGPLSEAQRAEFLQAYPDRGTVARYRQMASLFHLRIAAYCQWKVDRGNNDYKQAFELELSAINHADCHEKQAG